MHLQGGTARGGCALGCLGIFDAFSPAGAWVMRSEWGKVWGSRDVQSHGDLFDRGTDIGDSGVVGLW